MDPTGSPIRRDFTLADLRAAIGSTPVERVVVVQVLNNAEETAALLQHSQDAADVVTGVVGWVDLAEPSLSEVPWAAGLRGLAREPNVSCKLSGVQTMAAPDWRFADLAPFLDLPLDAFGADRILFGSDWPVSTQAASYQDVLDVATTAGVSGRCDVIDVVVGSPGAVVEIDAVAADEGAGNRPRPRKGEARDVRSYLALLRGVNVGGKNKLAMAALSGRLTDLGLEDVSKVLATGNVLLRSSKPARTLGQQIESVLVEDFGLRQDPVKVLVLTAAQVKAVVEDKPDRFGDEPDTYHCDAIFLMGISASSALTAFNPREGVDRIWPGEDVIYSQRLSAQRTKSRLSTVMSSPLYKSMTIRSWSTTVKLNNRLSALDASR